MFCLEDFIQTDCYIVKDLKCLLEEESEHPRLCETMIVAGVKGHALIDDRQIYSIVASKGYDGGLYYTQMKFIYKTIIHALELEKQDKMPQN